MKHLKRNLALLSVVALSFILTACSTAPITSHSTGFWDGVIVYNFSKFIIYLSKICGNNYGWGIIAGCLPLIIQLPVMYALYAAVSRTQVLKEGTFLWLQLNDKDPYYILPILAAIFTFLSTWLSMKAQPAGAQNGMTSAMTFGMPLIILITALNFPAAITLYWVVTNLFQVGQTLVIQNPFKIQKERQAKLQAEKAKRKAIEKAKRKAMKSKRK